MAIIKLSKNERRRASVFITCLILAVVAWLLSSLSSPQEYKIKIAVNFSNPPQRRSFRSLQPDTIEAKIKGTGWNLLLSSINADNTAITVSLKDLDQRNYIVLSNQLAAINQKRPVDRAITKFSPDTLYFDFSSRAVKRVPVQVLYRIGFKKQFGIADQITLRPNYVTLSGPADVLQKITSWKTDSLVLKDVETPIDQTVRLQGVRESNMTIYPKSVQVRIPVDEFTEKTVQIPVKLINNKNYYNVKLFPQKVKVTFLVSLGKYPGIDNGYFEAVADLDQWHEKGYEELPVKLTSFPDYCKIVSIEPRNLDFIVKK
ncbi:CdaR family protein [Mucilaginibacter sp. AW1-3]